jgi:uncharacterized membrane protein YjgN (DUF898 family)
MNDAGPPDEREADHSSVLHEAGASEAPPLTMRREGFVFSGNAREYFGIWIVNVLLTILTLGVYSAWAKVRRMRYFYGNTSLAGSSFDYHARPVKILIGRVVVLVAFALYNLALQVFPVASLFLIVGFLFLVPWFVMRGLRFSARVTSYRNVRFDFTGGYWEAFLAYVLGGLLTWGSLGLLAPVASRWSWNYTLGHLTYGGRPIDCDPRLEKLFGQWWMPAMVFVGGIVALAVLTLGVGAVIGSGLAGVVGGGGGAGAAMAGMLLLVYLGFVPLFLLYVLVGLLYRAGSRNVALNETVIDGMHALSSTISRWRYAWIAISNFFATVLTLGMLRPWAAVRMARYLAGATALYSLGSLDDYLGALEAEGAAVGAEYMDVEGLDFGF